MRKKRELRDLIARMSGVVYPALLTEYTFDCCIAAAAILKRVFAHYGYEADAVPVSVVVLNAPMVKMLATPGFRLPPPGPERERLYDLRGAWAVGITEHSAAPHAKTVFSSSGAVFGGRFGGHLIVRVGPYFVDAALQQVERKHKGILVPDLIAAEYKGEFERGEPVLLKVGECVLRYERISDESFRSAPDWTRRSTPVPETVSKIIKGIEAREASA